MIDGDTFVIVALALPAIVSILAFWALREEPFEDDAHSFADGDCWPVNLISHGTQHNGGGQQDHA